jgi:hypothetical protein
LARWDPLPELTHRREDGDLSGAGPKVWPNSLGNLYCWIQHGRPAEWRGDLRERVQLLGNGWHDSFVDLRPPARSDGMTERH